MALAPAPAGPALEGEASGGSEATTVAGLSCEESLSEDEVIAVLAEATVGEDGGVRPRQRRRRPANDRDERPPALNEALLYFRTGLCPPPSIYGDQASPDALDVANEMMAMLQLPGKPGRPSSDLARLKRLIVTANAVLIQLHVAASGQ